MAVVLVGSQWWYARIAPPVEEAAPADTTRVVEAERGREAPAVSPTKAGPRVDRDAAVEPPVDANVGDESGVTVGNELLVGVPTPNDVVVETPLYRATIDPVGGSLRQIELKRYPSFQGSNPVVRLIPEAGVFFQRVADLGDRRLRFGDLVFAPDRTEIRLEEGASPETLELAYEGSGQRVTQRYRFVPDRYVIDYEVDLGEPVDGVLVSGLGPRVQSNEKRPTEDYRQMRAVVRIDDEIVSRQAKDVDDGETSSLAGRIDWAGLKSKYFLAMILAPAEGATIRAATLSGSTTDTVPSLDVAIGTTIEGGRSEYRIYTGPQEYGRLSSLNEGLDEVNQYGWSWIRWMVTPFAKWIVILMLWLHRFIPSYGLVLIVFGLLVRVVMWPLTTKSYRSIRAMQKLQPEIQRIREQYKNDPQRMQQETMSLYRENKVNPLGGCLPNLIPLPILFALFFVFQGTIEFRGQPFLWLPDLSLPDPIYILPVFMGATIWASSKMTQTDPKMAAMTWLMPIVLTFVFFNLASGLVLYYAFSNLLTFFQQWWLRKVADQVVEEAPAPT